MSTIYASPTHGRKMKEYQPIDYAGNMGKEEVKAKIRAGHAARVTGAGGKVEKAWLGQGMAKASGLEGVPGNVTGIRRNPALRQYPQPDMGKVTAFLRFRGMI